MADSLLGKGLGTLEIMSARQQAYRAHAAQLKNIEDHILSRPLPGSYELAKYVQEHYDGPIDPPFPEASSTMECESQKACENYAWWHCLLWGGVESAAVVHWYTLRYFFVNKCEVTCKGILGYGTESFMGPNTCRVDREPSREPVTIQ